MVIKIDLGLGGDFENKILSEEQIVEHVIRIFRYTFPIRVLQSDMIPLIDVKDILDEDKYTFVDNIRTGEFFVLFIDKLTYKLTAKKLFTSAISDLIIYEESNT